MTRPLEAKILLRVGEDKRGVVGLQKVGVAGEVEPGEADEGRDGDAGPEGGVRDVGERLLRLMEAGAQSLIHRAGQ